MKEIINRELISEEFDADWPYIDYTVTRKYNVTTRDEESGEISHYVETEIS